VAAISFLTEPNFLDKANQYQNARLVIPGKDAKDQRWLIIFYVYDAQQGKVVRKRNFECNKFEDLKKRQKFADKFIKQVNDKLAEGFIVDSQKTNLRNTKTKIETKENITIKEALDLALLSKTKLRAKTQYNYNTYVIGFYKFIDSSANISSINEKLCKKFLKDLELKTDFHKPLGIRTINNYHQHLSTLFQYLVQEEIIKENPWVKIPHNKNPRGKNLAFTPDQQKKLLDYMDKNCPKLLLFCKTMYYTLARPNELCNLKIKHIDMYRPQHLYIPAAISKNGIERHVSLPPPIYKLLAPLKKQPQEYYIFGKGIQPNSEPYPARYISSSYNERVLKKLKFGTDYTMYSWKHTGVVTNYLNGMSSGALRMQIGHSDTGSFETYLKSLGLFENNEVMNNYVELPK